MFIEVTQFQRFCWLRPTRCAAARTLRCAGTGAAALKAGEEHTRWLRTRSTYHRPDAGTPWRQPAHLHQVLHGDRLGHGAAALAGRAMAEQLRNARRPSVMYLSFQECTGCLESLTRSFAPTIEDLIFNMISLDYNDTLMAAAGRPGRSGAGPGDAGQFRKVHRGGGRIGADGRGRGATTAPAAERCRHPARGGQGGRRHRLRRAPAASFGGIPFAEPNPTSARPVSAMVGDRPIINVSGCPPIPEVITGDTAAIRHQRQVPELDEHRRPKVFFGNTIHDRCYRRPFYDQGKFAKVIRRRGRAQRLVPVRARLQGADHLQRLRDDEVERRYELSDRIRAIGCMGCSEPDSGTRAVSIRPCRPLLGARRGEAASGEVSKVVGTAAAVRRRDRRRICRHRPPAQHRTEQHRPEAVSRKGVEHHGSLELRARAGTQARPGHILLGRAVANRRLRAAAPAPSISKRAAQSRCSKALWPGGLVAMGSRSWPHPEFIAPHRSRRGTGLQLSHRNVHGDTGVRPAHRLHRQPVRRDLAGAAEQLSSR